MRIDDKYVYRARVCIELVSPLTIATGEKGATANSPIVRDANGLPYIPATALVGAWRAMFARLYDQKDVTPTITEQVFGYQREGKVEDQGQPSSLSCTNALVHNASNNVMDWPLTADKLSQLQVAAAPAAKQAGRDEVLALLLQLTPVFRHQIGINDRGVVEERAKYDRTAVPVGCRFTFDVTLFTKREDKDLWAKLYGALSHKQLSLGGQATNGGGRFKIVSAKYINKSLIGAGGRGLFKQWPTRLSASNFGKMKVFDWQDDNDTAALCAWQTFTTQLSAEGTTWGFQVTRQAVEDKKFKSKMAPTPEQCIVWPAEKQTKQKVKVHRKNKNTQPTKPRATVEPFWLVPGSSIKGALRHRVLFNLCRINQVYAGSDEVAEIEERVTVLFGKAAEEEQGQVGKLVVADQFLSVKDSGVKQCDFSHNVIDRFTGGSLDGLLFNRTMLYGGSFELAVHYPAALFANEANPDLYQALTLAIEEIGNGTVALGANTSSGHGRFISDAKEVRL